MVSHKRRKELLKMVIECEKLTIKQLSVLLDASPATVRRDIDWLAERSLLVKMKGGAQNPSLRMQHPLSGETFQNALQCHATSKRAIARQAASMCTDGETIIINGGTTTFMMADFLADRRMTVLTNSFLMAQKLQVSSENEIFIPGGRVYREQNVILSPFDNDITQSHYASKMFMSVQGLSTLGLMESDPLLIQAEQRLINQAEELVVLADSSKFTRKAGLILCGLERVSCVITDTDVSETAVNILEQHGIKVITVQANEERAHGYNSSLNRQYTMDVPEFGRLTPAH
ncbi:DeoR/GlpR family DNA-binding transcription regulator [Massilia luteola]|uniref:DeoR/GlpR family DNA-binding transcription regulator n=1 Tax=Massilia luteola TaxID=3081751 RepID=UPI002ACBDCC7|nr:DeoR/GlpR family DNA-binding transcription regulator [Massilia sp. Gc5]